MVADPINRASQIIHHLKNFGEEVTLDKLILECSNFGIDPKTVIIGYDSDYYNAEIIVKFTRLETPEELAERIRIEEEMHNREKERKKKEKENRELAERKEFERLFKKYGNKAS